MADREGEGKYLLAAWAKKVKELLLEDLIARFNKYEELFKKFQEESDETQEDYESEKEEVMQEVAGLAKRITQPDLREAVILAFQKQKEDSRNSSFTLIEMMIGSFKGYLKDRKPEIGSVDNNKECSLDELLNKLSEISQQVIDLKDP